MPVTVTQEVHDIPSIKPVRINPSIVEGSVLYTSILGPKKSKTLVRYGPTFLTAPVLSGSSAIPALLSCSAGVVDSSPASTRYYQWFVDGVADLGGLGPAFSTFLTNLSHDGKTITCQVTATNPFGSDSETSNGITVSRVEDVNVWMFDTYTVSGVVSDEAITVYDNTMAVITGMWLDDFSTVFGYSTFAVTGIENQDLISLYHVDTYILNQYTPLETVAFTNPGAESGTTGWTTTAGTLRSVSITNKPPGTTGSFAFMGVASSGIQTVANNVFDLPSAHHTLIDAGQVYASLEFFACQSGNINRGDQMRCYYEVLDASDVVIATVNQFGYFVGILNIVVTGANDWEFRVSVPTALPSGARKIRIILDFTAEGSSGNICQADDLSFKLYQAS